MSWLTELIRPKIRSLVRKKDLPDNLWKKCEECEQMIFHKELAERLFVCRHCGHHMRWEVEERLNNLFDEGRYQVVATPAAVADPLGFRDRRKYTDRLKEASQKTPFPEAIVIATGLFNGSPLVCACFNFEFIGGSMGVAVGEALVIAACLAVEKKAPLLTIPASGGARMQEGMLSLIQMPRSVLAVTMVKEAGLPVINLLTNPTTGGVAASFASLGDIIIAEPGAIIGFTGARVIQETLRQPLPPGFQTTEFQKDHGFIDLIIPRQEIRSLLGKILKILKKD